MPIHDIRITFAPGYRFGRVHLEPEGQDLKVEPTPGGPSVVVPRLDIHAMVVAELAPQPSESVTPSFGAFQIDDRLLRRLESWRSGR